MKDLYTAEDIDGLEACAEIDALAAMGMGWTYEVFPARNSAGVFVDELGNTEIPTRPQYCVARDGTYWDVWQPSHLVDGWSDAGRLLDEASGYNLFKSTLDLGPEKHGGHVEFRSAHAPTGPLAITRAFCKARLDVINKVLGAEAQ